MNKITKKIAVSMMALTTSVAAWGHGNVYGEDGKLIQHDELSVKLPFDPVFCDLNDNGIVDPEEMTTDNLCMIEGSNNLFSQKPLAALGLQKGQLVLTVDDGPNPNTTPKILDLLDQYNIKATFFVVGSRVAPYANLIRQIEARGHTIGNHTFTHDVPHITADTIVSEVLRANTALVGALGHQPKGRLLFRAPGLGWSSPKAINLNDNSVTRDYIGPIHANIGTDAPRADWSCWSKHVTTEDCGQWYFDDIMKAGRGIILSHDIFYKPGQGNTYEMWKLVLNWLDTKGGGIKNKNGTGVWEFVTLEKLSALDQFETGHRSSGVAPTAPVPAPSQPAPSSPTQPSTPVQPSKPVQPPQPAPQNGLISKFSRLDTNVRSNAILNFPAGVTADSLIDNGQGKPLTLANLISVRDLNHVVTIGKSTFKEVRIEQAQPGFERFVGQTVYVWSAGF